MGEKRIAYRVEDGEDREEIHCTTYQMRNPFRQMADGLISELDVHCYAQHEHAAKLLPSDGWCLDLCCGRGLMIPFLRYHAKSVGGYVGVDIHPKNAKWKDGADPRDERRQKDDWGFPREFIAGDIGNPDLADLLMVDHQPFDLIIFTSSIEHMQPEAQQQALKTCGALLAKDAKLYLSCPVMAPGKSGWDCRYKAHVYEPCRAELEKWLAAADLVISDTRGLVTACAEFRAELSGLRLQYAEALYRNLPRAFALPAIAAIFPECATEMAFICEGAT